MADEMAVTITTKGVRVDGHDLPEGETVTMRGAVARSLIRRKLARKPAKADAAEAVPVAEVESASEPAPAKKKGR